MATKDPRVDAYIAAPRDTSLVSLDLPIGQRRA